MADDVARGWFSQSLDSSWRRETDGLGSGLSRALAARLGVDVVLVRVAFVVLAFCSGLGVALYAWGTLLTPGPEGRFPIDSTLPRMRNWSEGARIAMVVATTVGLVAAVGSLTSLPWGLAILAGALLAWWLRRNRAALVAPVQAIDGEQPDAEALVADWRRRMSSTLSHTPSPTSLPVVDLYSPEPEEPAARPVARPAWLAGLILTLVAGASGAVAALVFGLSPAVAVALGTAVLGGGTVVFAVATRSRRLPRPFLALLLVPLVACGWLATGAGAQAAPSSGTYEVRVIADTRTVDLTGVDLTDVTQVDITAVGSDVEVLVPGIPEHGFSVDETAGTVTLPDTSARQWHGVTVTIDAVGSEVRVVEVPHG